MNIPTSYLRKIFSHPFMRQGLIVAGVLLLALWIGYRPPIAPYWIAAGLGLLLAGLFALHSTPAALTLLVATSPILDLSLSTGTQSPLHFSLVWIGLCTAVWMLRMLVEKRFRFIPSPANRPLLFFNGAALLSWLAGYAFWKPTVPRPANALVVQAGQVAIFILSAAAFFLAANHPFGEKDLRRWNSIIIALGLGGIVLDLLPFSQRPAGLTGGMLMWPLMLLWAQLLFNPNLPRLTCLLGWLSLPLWGLWVWQVAFAWKGGWLPALLGLGILLFLRSRQAFVLFLAVCVVWISANWEGLAPLTYLPEEQGGSLLRPYIWYDVLRLSAYSPLLGLGPANYMYYWRDPTFASFSLEHTNWWAWYYWGYAPPSHNMFIDIFAQTGLVGMFFFLWAIVALLRLTHRAGRDLPPGFAHAYARGVQAGFLALLIASFAFADWLLPFVYNITIKGFQHSVYSWLLLGSLVPLLRGHGTLTRERNEAKTA